MIENRNRSLQKLIDGLLNDKVGAMENGLCVYKGQGGKRCAIGIMLDDSLVSNLDYHENSLPYRDLLLHYPNLEKELGLTRSQGAFLQEWHDTAVEYRWEGVFSREKFISALEDIVSGNTIKMRVPGMGMCRVWDSEETVDA
jgi:hypothetical protein